MLIGELAARTGLSQDTIRYYEKRGLISSRRGRGHSRYKDYPDEVIDNLRLVSRLKDFGFTLSEIDIFLRAIRDNEPSCAAMLPMLHQKLGKLRAELEILEKKKSELERSLQECEDDQCDVIKPTRRRSHRNSSLS